MAFATWFPNCFGRHALRLGQRHPLHRRERVAVGAGAGALDQLPAVPFADLTRGQRGEERRERRGQHPRPFDRHARGVLRGAGRDRELLLHPDLRGHLDRGLHPRQRDPRASLQRGGVRIDPLGGLEVVQHRRLRRQAHRIDRLEQQQIRRRRSRRQVLEQVLVGQRLDLVDRRIGLPPLQQRRVAARHRRAVRDLLRRGERRRLGVVPRAGGRGRGHGQIIEHMSDRGNA